jgi:uncharacterized protein DUF6152
MSARTLLLAGLFLPVLNGVAVAHHSFSMFDAEKTSTMTGIVKEFEFANPHGWIHMMATDSAGKQMEWSFEMQPVSQLAPAGWKADTLKPGDRITIDFHPLKDGARGGQFITATLPDGKKLRDRKE